ncbi:hypothetical protein ACFLSA_03180 [Bacteroidota bacterium]
MLHIKTKLTSDTLKLKNIKKLIGKEVEITIREVRNKKEKHHWDKSGSVNLKGKLDNSNIRNFAHE